MIVVGGGSSTRFGADKLMIEVAGKPLVLHTIDAVLPSVDVCVVVCRPAIAATVGALRPEVTMATGGATRTLSEMAGLAALGGDVDLIGIHDAARPMVSAAQIDELFEIAHDHGGALPLLESEGLMVDRRTHGPVPGLRRAQTPQAFRGPELMASYVRAARAGFDGHDTVDVVQQFSELTVIGVPGSPDNLKVTYPVDIEKIRDLLTDPSRT